MPMVKAVRYAASLLLAATVGLALVGFLPATVQADTTPVDLVLGGEGATLWSITNIQPTDSGTKTLELHNAGSKDGFVTIWISNIVSSEGTNPESETGDISEPGEIDDHLLLNLSADGLSTNLDLPTTIDNLPQSYSAPNYIEVIPLEAGDTVSLQWEWELPAQARNDVQGDTISFTIVYLLREFEVTDVSGVVTEEGKFSEECTIECESGKGEITIEEDTVGQTEAGEPLTEIWLIEIDKEPSALSEEIATVSPHYEAGPRGTTFDPPVTITLRFEPTYFPEGAIVESLVIAEWDKDAGEWVELEGCTTDWRNYTISAPVSHFSRYTTIAHIAPPPPPPYFPVAFPPAISPGEKVTVTAILETNMLGNERRVEIGADGTLPEPLTITDRSGNFTINIDRGTRITGPNNVILSRIEMTIVEESIAVPDDIVVLSPTYKLTGYTDNIEVSRINFDPSAILTINYDPSDLPENILPPFVAYYTVDRGLVPIEPPLGSTVEIGRAEAQISHASLFVVAAKLVPPPPPLPAKFELGNLTIEPRQARAGQPVIISLEIANDGETTGSYELQLRIDGIVRAIQEITVAAKSSKIVSFEISNLAVGRHQVEVAGLSGELRIIGAVVTPVKSTVDWFTLDLGIGAGVVVVLLTLYLLRRRL